MGELKHPLFSLDVHGSIGDSLTFQGVRRTHRVREKPHPVDPRSLLQLSWRHMYQKAVVLWHALSPAEKQDWNSQASERHMTGFAWFMSQALKPNPGLYLPLQGGTMQGDIHMDSHKIDTLPTPGKDTEAATKKYVDDLVAILDNPPRVNVYRYANQSILDNTNTPVSWQSARYDTDAMFNFVANPTRLTCNTEGIYLFIFGASFLANATGWRALGIRLNGSTMLAWDSLHIRSDNGYFAVVSRKYPFHVGDYVEAMVWQTSGAALALRYVPNYSPEFTAHRLSALPP